MADTKEFLLPDLGEGLTEGEIVNWLVAPGDTVEVDQPVAEIETAKAVVEVTCPFAGTITTLHAEVGEEVDVGKPLVTIDVGGAGAGDGAAAVDGVAEPGGTSADAAAGDLVPEAKAGDAGDGDSGNVLVGYGTSGGRVRRRRGAGAAPPAGGPPARPAARERPLAKPPVRRMAKDHGIDLADVPGTGPGGIITRADVEAYLADGKAPAPAAAPTDAGRGRPPQAAPEPAAASRTAPAGDGLVRRVPLRGMRKAIAEKMSVSRREIPEATSWVDADATELVRLRDELNAAQEGKPEPVRVSPLALILRACVAGLREFPELGARLDTGTGEIVLPDFVNLGFAAQTDAGLMVPVIHRADRMSTLRIAAELTRLTAAARERSIKPEELTGGTFTVSNYGSFGVDGGNPVINHPEAAILGVGRITDRPWVHDGELAVRKVVQLSVAFDHRICDGGEAAGFLRFVADCVESPATLLGAL